MKQIKLTQGKVALVDDEDYEWLSQWKWRIRKGRNTFYADAHIDTTRKNRNKSFIMHRLIMKLDFDDKRQIDHINGNGLDNRKKNLRICTNQENSFNGLKKNGLNKYKGVSWSKRMNKYRAYIKVNYKQKHLGSFDNEINAAIAYNNAAKKLHGEFAKLNKI